MSSRSVRSQCAVFWWIHHTTMNLWKVPLWLFSHQSYGWCIYLYGKVSPQCEFLHVALTVSTAWICDDLLTGRDVTDKRSVETILLFKEIHVISDCIRYRLQFHKYLFVAINHHFHRRSHEGVPISLQYCELLECCPFITICEQNGEAIWATSLLLASSSSRVLPLSLDAMGHTSDSV